jgi:queuine tRNA-ribosyltransferase
MSAIKFSIEKKLPNSLGRAGVIKTPHGDIQTPAFVTVGTKSTVKSLSPEQVQDLGAQVVLANTYHLYLQPGDDVVRDGGGLGKYMNWSGPTMTDSGGFQVFSLGAAFNRKVGKISKTKELLLPESHAIDEDKEIKLGKATIDPNGVTFRSHIDGSAHYFTPEKSIDIQHNLGADIIFAFDECTGPDESDHYQSEALDRTHRWAKQSLEYHKKSEFAEKQAIFGIVQGGRSEKLRKESAKAISEMMVNNPVVNVTSSSDSKGIMSHSTTGFDGFGIGGSFEKEDMMNAVKWCNEILPEEKPRHLLGIGEPADLFGAVENGCDLFDCVAATRQGRNGTIYTKDGRINILNNQFRKDFTPIESDCGCYACKNYTRSYICHLFRANEMFASTLASIHNLYFIIHMVDKMRQTILDGNFFEYKKDFLSRYYPQD